MPQAPRPPLRLDVILWNRERECVDVVLEKRAGRRITSCVPDLCGEQVSCGHKQLDFVMASTFFWAIMTASMNFLFSEQVGIVFVCSVL